jgi:hypothetical protein
MLTKEQFIDNLKKARAVKKEIFAKFKNVPLESYPEYEEPYRLDNKDNLFEVIMNYLYYGVLPEGKTLDDVWDAFQEVANKEKWDVSEIQISFDSDELIQDCLADIALLGEDFMVYAKYQSFCDGQVEFVVDYVDAERPTRKDILEFNAIDDEETFQELLKEYEEGIKSLKGYRTEKMTLQELLNKLEKQNTIL